MSTELPPLSPARHTVQQDDARLRITLWEFPPNSETGWHRHGHDYIVVPVLGGVLTIVGKDGERRESPIVAGRSYSRGEGVEHNVVNLTGAMISFVEIELK